MFSSDLDRSRLTISEILCLTPADESFSVFYKSKSMHVGLAGTGRTQSPIYQKQMIWRNPNFWAYSKHILEKIYSRPYILTIINDVSNDIKRHCFLNLNHGSNQEPFPPSPY